MSEWTQEHLEEAVNKVAAKAATDPAFRSKAVNDPASAVLEATGEALPSDFNLRFVDPAGTDMTIVLPEAMESDELSDEELEEAAGGFKVEINGFIDKSSSLLGNKASPLPFDKYNKSSSLGLFPSRNLKR